MVVQAMGCDTTKAWMPGAPFVDERDEDQDPTGRWWKLEQRTPLGPKVVARACRMLDDRWRWMTCTGGQGQVGTFEEARSTAEAHLRATTGA